MSIVYKRNLLNLIRCLVLTKKIMNYQNEMYTYGYILIVLLYLLEIHIKKTFTIFLINVFNVDILLLPILHLLRIYHAKTWQVTL